MRQTLFVVSDIHGHYTELITALERVGFDENDPNHIFVSCGDLFDRGRENAAVYDFVKRLPRKILIKGNHEDMLYDILERGNLTREEIWNETDITIAEMLGDHALDKNGCFDKAEHAEKIKELQHFIDTMADYYETKEYVFTHGWLPITFEGRFPVVCEKWRDASASEWVYAHTLEWQQLYDVGAVLKEKIIVCGHRPARMGDMFDFSREPDNSEPFYGNGMIAIDAGTVRSGRVNVLVFENTEG